MLSRCLKRSRPLHWAKRNRPLYWASSKDTISCSLFVQRLFDQQKDQNFQVVSSGPQHRFCSTSVDNNTIHNETPKQQSLAARSDDLCNKDLYPIGSFAPEVSNEALDILHWWTGIGNIDSIFESFRLLERLAVEDLSDGKLVKSISAVLQNWANCELNNTQNANVVLNRFSKIDLNSHLQPSHYAMILDSVTRVSGKEATSRDAQMRRLLKRIQKQFEMSNEQDLQLREHAQNISIRLWAREGLVNKSIDLTKRLIDGDGSDEERPPFKIHDKTFMTLLVLFLQKDSRYDAEIEAFLRWTAEPYEQNLMKVKPSSIALLAWVLFHYPTGKEIEELILNETDWIGCKVSKGLESDFETYQSALEVWAFAGDAVRAKAILDRMSELAKKGDASLQPNTHCYNIVLSCLAHSDDPDAAMKGKEILTVMSESEIIKPNYQSYYSVIQCCSNSKHSDAIKWVEEILMKMGADARGETNSQRSPDRFLYLEVIATLSEKGASSDTIVSILEEMLAAYKAGNESARPLVDHFTAAMSACARSQDYNAGEMGSALFRRMQELYPEGIIEKEPKISLGYHMLMNCWKSSGHPMAMEEMKEIALEMEARMAEERNSTHPYLVAMKFWAGQGDAERTETLLRDMYAEFLDGNEQLEPRTMHFNWVLEAWSCSEAPRGAQRAQAIFEHMHELHEAKLRNTKPSAKSYNCLRKCWEKSNLPEAAERLESLRKEREKNGF